MLSARAERCLQNSYKHKRRRGAPKPPAPAAADDDGPVSMRKWAATHDIVVRRNLWSEDRADALDAIKSDGAMYGFKLVGADLCGIKGFKFKVGEQYTEPGDDIHLGKKGFHFSLHPVRAARSVKHNNLKLPLRLVRTRATGLIKYNGFAAVAQTLEIIAEIDVCHASGIALERKNSVCVCGLKNSVCVCGVRKYKWTAHRVQNGEVVRSDEDPARVASYRKLGEERSPSQKIENPTDTAALGCLVHDVVTNVRVLEFVL